MINLGQISISLREDFGSVFFSFLFVFFLQTKKITKQTLCKSKKNLRNHRGLL